MSVEFVEGFAWLANGETSTTLENLILERWDLANLDAGTNKSIIVGTDPGPGKSLKFGDAANTNYIEVDLPGTPQELYLSMRVKWDGDPDTLGAGDFLTLESSAGTAQFIADFVLDGVLVVERVGSIVFNSGAVVTSGGVIDWHINEWFTMEVYLKVDDTTGAWEIRINGTTIGSETNVDTRGLGPTATVDAIRIENIADSTNGGWKLRDIIAFSGTGSSNNTWVGENKHVYTIFPNADTATEDWTLSTGTDSYALIDEVSNDGNTTYIESSTATDVTLCDYEASGSESNINCLSIHTTAALDAAGSETFDDVVKEGTTTTNSSAHTVASTSYAMFETYYDTNPDTSSAWTSSEIDAVQGGVEKN